MCQKSRNLIEAEKIRDSDFFFHIVTFLRKKLAPKVVEIQYTYDFECDSYPPIVAFIYKTDAEVKNYEADGTSEQIRLNFLQLVTEAGYFEKFKHDVEIKFDSDERVQRDCQGNYFYYWR